MTDASNRGAKFEEEIGNATQEPAFKVWSREEAEALREMEPPLSPWWVVAVQAGVGVLYAALVWGITQRSGWGWSSLYGVAAVVLPAALLARGMSKNLRRNAGAAVFGFMFWEMIKIALTVAMLAAARKVVPELSWPALLVAMVVCVKVNWLALLWRRRPVPTTKIQRV